MAEVPRLGMGMMSKWSPGTARRSGTIRRVPSSIASRPFSNHSSGVCRASWWDVNVVPGSSSACTVWVRDFRLVLSEKFSEVGWVSLSNGSPPPE